MVLNALFFLNNVLHISLNIVAATLMFLSFLYLCKIKNPFYPYLTFAMMICYFAVTVELYFEPMIGIAGAIIQITIFIVFFPWLVYAIKTIRTPLVGRDKILRMWTTHSYVEDEKEREDYTEGLNHAKVKLGNKKKEIRGKYNALIIQIVSAIYVVFFLVTYFYGLLI